jgi:hypothetical protein
MRSASRAAAAAIAAALGAACGGHGPSAPAAPPRTVTGDNVLPLSVNGAHCTGGSAAYPNMPCVSVKLCQPGTSTCQTVDGILLDTGSIGLRVFRQALALDLPPAPAPAGGGSLAECVQFADLSADWGPVAAADVVLGGEPAVRVPIQVIDATFGTVPGSCPSPETGPTSFNGILGVGFFTADCGPTCPVQANVYFASAAGAATPIALDAAAQVQNPVALLPGDGNGVIVSLPGVPAGGAPAVEGALVLGIGTRANNAPGSASALALDRTGEFDTTIDGGSPQPGSFADTGSNGYFFTPPASVPTCGDYKDWFCPPSTRGFDATNAPAQGGGGVRASLELGSFDAVVVQPRNGHAVFAEIGGPGIPNAGMDWGLPFFLGRDVYLGYEGRSSPLGAGPLLAW